jgi:catechol 2,3-dioxygenase-like lactoylglutathione lyase family enzyme
VYEPALDQLNLVVADMEATLAFYRALGLDIPEKSIWRTETGAHHVDVVMSGGFELAFDSLDLARAYNEGWREPSGFGTRALLSFRLPSRDAVDEIHRKLAALGHATSQPPCDTFWGSRFAIIDDPDGNQVGLMSPPDPDRRRAPPPL